MTTKKLYIKTWGCQMNVYDSARIADVVRPLGYQVVDDLNDADFIILNTCHIREKATEKLFSELGRMRMLQKEKEAAGQRLLIGVAGCVAQAEGAEIQRRAPYVDLVFGPQTYHKLPEMIAGLSDGQRVIDTSFPAEPKFDHLPARDTHGGVSSFLTIQEGCDKFCSYCVVPYTRGAEYSRPAAMILDEARSIVASGVREITLLGQNVNGYRDGDTDFAALLYKMAEIPDLLRLRYTTSHPQDVSDALIDAHRDLEILMPFLHLPVQSGSDSILKDMNRKHTADDYRRLINRLRAARPDLALSSDFIVGFPGETDRDFDATMQLVQDIGFAQAYSFKYSRRLGTPAASMQAQVDEKVKDERLGALQDLLRAQQRAFNARFVGTSVPVLFDGASHHGEQHVFGRTPYMQSVHARGAATLGTVRDVHITYAGLANLRGVMDGDA